jgi:hypothetical protein
LDGPRRLGPPGHASVYFADPFGNLLELATMGYTSRVIEGLPDIPSSNGERASNQRPLSTDRKWIVHRDAKSAKVSDIAGRYGKVP